MRSNQVASIDQKTLNNKMDLFLKNIATKNEKGELVTESMPKWAFEGLCNAYAFMIFRAEIIGEKDKHLDRLSFLSQATKKQIKKMASLLSEYKSNFQEMVKEKRSQLEKKLKECKTDQERKSIKKEFYDGIEKECVNKLSNEDKQLLSNANELYTFINSLLFAFDPLEHLNLRVKGKAVTQNDFIEILDVLYPDMALDEKSSNVNLPIKKAASYQFSFTQEELAKLFKDLIFDGDVMRIDSSDHAMYLSKNNGKYLLYDPNNKKGPVEFSTAEDLVSAVRNCFYTNFKHADTYLPIGIEIFEKNNIKHTRPTSSEFIELMLKNRGENLNINAKGWDGATSLSMAAWSGNADAVSVLLKNNANPEIAIRDKERNFTAAHLAAGENHVSVMQVLIKHKPSLKNIEDNHGSTPAFDAAKLGNIEVLEVLINEKIDLNKKNDDGETLAHIAAEHGHTNVIELLAKHSAKLNEPMNDGRTPAIVAAEEGHINILEALEKNGVNLKSAANSLLKHAASSNQINVLEYFEKKGMYLKDICSQDEIADLGVEAAKNGHVNMLELLITKGFDFKKSGENLVLVSVMNNDVKVLELLAKNGLKLDQHGADLLGFVLATGRVDNYGAGLATIASLTGKSDILESLIKSGFDLKPKSEELAKNAATKGQINILQTLVKNGLVSNDQIFNLAYSAVENKQINVLEVLLKSRAIPEKKSLHLAVLAVNIGETSLLEVVIKNGISSQQNFKILTLLAQSKNNNNILSSLAYLAVDAGNLDLLKYMITLDVDLKKILPMNDKYSLGQAAVKSGNMEVIKFLAENGVDLNQNNLKKIETSKAAPEIKQEFSPSVKAAIDEVKVLIKDYRENASFYTVRYKEKADNLEASLERAIKHFKGKENEPDADKFLKEKVDNKDSVEDVLKRARRSLVGEKIFGKSSLFGNTSSYSRVKAKEEQAVKNEVIKSPKKS